MGELAFAVKMVEDEAPVGIPNEEGSSEAKAIKYADDMITVKTTYPAEEV